MNIVSRTTRHVRIGDDAISCTNLEIELREEIAKVKDHITSLQRKGIAAASELQHMQELLDYREAVLDWLQSDNHL